MTTTTGKYVGYTITELEHFCLWEVGQVTATTPSYAKFPRWLLRSKFNERQLTVVALSKCLRKLALIPTQDGRRTYRLPMNCMDDGVISAKFFTSATDYTDLTIRDTQWLDSNRQGWRTEAEDDPDICFHGPSYGNVQTISVHPVCDTDAVSYYDAKDTGVYGGTTAPAASCNLSGTTTSLGSSTLLNDTATTFTAEGLVAGMCVRNLTDGSFGPLGTIATNALTLSTALTGGSDNLFQSGDSYMVLAGEYAVVTDVAKEDRYVFASEIGMLENLTVPAHTLLVEYTPYPLAFPFNPATTDVLQGYLNMYPEIPKIYHYGLAMGVVADLLRTFNENTSEFKRADVYETAFKTSAMQAIEAKSNRPFETAGVTMLPTMRRRR